jgi:hypothetical protein
MVKQFIKTIREMESYAGLVEAVLVGRFDGVVASVRLVGYWQHQSVGVLHLIFRDGVVLVVNQRLAILEPDDVSSFLIW